MDIHEYQAKEILAGFGVRIPRGALAYSPEQAAYRIREIGGNAWLVKAQIHSGGRGKVGAVKYCTDEVAVVNAARDLFGKRVVTHQTGPEGKIVYRIYVEEAVDIEHEFYLGFVLDRKSERVMIVASRAGGTEIEEISASQPDSIIRSVVEPAVGIQAFQAREVAFQLGVEPARMQRVVDTIMACYAAFIAHDANMLEINPLVLTKSDRILALDAKMAFDDNALYRNTEISELRDKSQEDPRETRAADWGLSYVGLEGQIGCIVNGAGLAMATMDMIKLSGAEPANFLDIGGGATPDRVARTFELIRLDKNVKVVLVNIFAGINRCDWVADGVVQALKQVPLDMPLVVRLAGTNVDEGKRILKESGLPIQSANTLEEAANMAVASLKE